MYSIHALFDLSHTRSADYLQQFRYGWEALQDLKSFITELGPRLGDAYTEVAPQVWVHQTATIAPSAFLVGPCIIGANTEVRHCAFIRGSALVGDGCVVGNSVELKNVILFDKVQVPHFNYVGDSILGYKAHMGAGSITSNVRADRRPVVIHGSEEIPTDYKKVGAMLGDYAEIGCNAVLNPGTVVGRKSIVYPLSNVRRAVPENSICKADGTIVPRR